MKSARLSMRARICEAIHSRPGITQAEIARLVYGPTAYPALVGTICRQLLEQGYVVRRGGGGSGDPFTYTWAVGRQERGFAIVEQHVDRRICGSDTSD